MKKSIYLLFMVVLISCSREEEKVITSPAPSKQYTKNQIDQLINNILHEKNEFKWEFVSSDVVASALANGDSLLAVGYQPQQYVNTELNFADLDIQAPEWKKARIEAFSKILSEIKKISGKVNPGDILVKEDEVLPFFVVKVAQKEIVEVLRNTKTVRYAEPLGYPFGNERPSTSSRIMGKFGCFNDPESFIPKDDYQPFSPGVKVSWNYRYMNIPQAWQYSTGRNIGVAIIDTGISPEQNKLGTKFNQGESIDRRFEKYGTFKNSIWPWASPDGPDDRCGHGTQMTGAMGAPRGTDSSAVGVAYNADVVGIRGTGDVVIETSTEQYGVIDALKLAGNLTHVKILSMSIGTPLWSGSVADAIRYAYGKGKLMFCAAGTSTSITNWYGVVFPASMNETVAITGIIEGRYKECYNCHKGGKVDFTIVMERSNPGKGTPLTLAHAGDQPSRVGGSSIATATTAGIAALVWSANPGINRAEVVDRLKRSADLYPNRNSDFGWGTIDALKAVVGE